ncbi:MAG TPA: hypothetical protein VGK41_00350 [Solirubrobacterales bacterium]
MNLLPAVQFRFTEADDVKEFGDGWWTYDEKALSVLRGRELIALEAGLDMPLIEAMDKFRERSTLGIMAAMWIALHRGGHDVGWADFNPATFLVEIKQGVAGDPLGEGSAESPPTDSPSSPELTEESVTSS